MYLIQILQTGIIRLHGIGGELARPQSYSYRVWEQTCESELDPGFPPCVQCEGWGCTWRGALPPSPCCKSVNCCRFTEKLTVVALTRCPLSLPQPCRVAIVRKLDFSNSRLTLTQLFKLLARSDFLFLNEFSSLSQLIKIIVIWQFHTRVA